jgi:drug/metabolite transporter (DMT)-like permease
VSLIAWLATGASPVVLSFRSGIAIFYLGIIGTLFCYFVAVWVQKYVSSLKVAIIFSLEPVFAAIIGFIILHEVLNIKELAGAIFILLGVIFHSAARNYIDRRKTEINKVDV